MNRNKFKIGDQVSICLPLRKYNTNKCVITKVNVYTVEIQTNEMISGKNVILAIKKEFIKKR